VHVLIPKTIGSILNAITCINPHIPSAATLQIASPLILLPSLVVPAGKVATLAAMDSLLLFIGSYSLSVYGERFALFLKASHR
jgi:hypothetical protein